MKKQIFIVFILFLLLPTFANAEPIEAHIKMAYIKDGFLWTMMNGKKEKQTKEPDIFPYAPQWSHDGKWILYQIETKEKASSAPEHSTEIWVYNIETKKHKRITLNGTNPKWSPVENLVAFKSGGVLNISDLDHFYNIALGVGDYNWFPDGRSLITSSSASLRPDGWTNPVLYKITLEKNLKKITSLTKHVKPFYTIPKELKKGNVSIIAIDGTDFQFSPDGKWISFIVGPTASWSMDSNMVCVLSSDGKNFEVLDEVILGVDHPQWALHKDLIGYIAGGGRIVFGFKNKNMKVTELPAYNTLSMTPAHFAELGFGWKDDNALYVSRVKEKEWSNEASKRPDPSLFLININDQKQTQITHPPAGLGDYSPVYIPSVSKVTWLRKKDIASAEENLWIANQDGKNAKLWIKNIGGYSFYENQKD